MSKKNNNKRKENEHKQNKNKTYAFLLAILMYPESMFTIEVKIARLTGAWLYISLFQKDKF